MTMPFVNEERPKITLASACRQHTVKSMRTQLVSAGLIAGLTAGGYAYAARWPTSQIFGRTLIAGSDIQEVALTFDDGPNDPYTFQLL
jgi:peptidoglycan/xylan/chitin deacetylase (PgdA/CDA1 family)